MLEKQYIQKHLAKTRCYKCGASLEEAKITTLSEVPVALVAHAKCKSCGAENMVTITVAGSGSTPIMSDLKAEEINKFVGARSISYDELLNLHELLEKKSLCKLLQKKEKNLEKAQKASEMNEGYLP